MLTKKLLIAAVAKELELPVPHVVMIVETLLRRVKLSLDEDEKVKITGFGTFSPVKTKHRKGINPFTGRPMTFFPKKTVRFKISSAFKNELLNK